MRGTSGNSGFIVGEDGVVVVDTGISYEHGREMLAAIARLSSKPVRLVIITHADQEFLFGNAAFDELGVPVLAQVKSLELMRQRCEHCLSNLNRLLGPQIMRGSRLVLPSRLVEKSATLAVAGLSLELLHFGWGSTPGDLAVFDPASGVLFAGALVSNRRIPDLRDSDLKGWLSALDQTDRIPCRVVVPGVRPGRRADRHPRHSSLPPRAGYGSATTLSVRRKSDGSGGCSGSARISRTGTCTPLPTGAMYCSATCSWKSRNSPADWSQSHPRPHRTQEATNAYNRLLFLRRY